MRHRNAIRKSKEAMSTREYIVKHDHQIFKPSSYKVYQKEREFELKIIAKDYFPKSFINREKGYFPMPALKYIKGKYYDFVYDILNSLSCKNRGLFNRNYVDNLLKSPNSNLTAIKGNKLWHLAATEYWLQKNID